MIQLGEHKYFECFKTCDTSSNSLYNKHTKTQRLAKIIINEHLGGNRWAKINGFAQIAELLAIGDLAQILKGIMALKEELSSIAETITKDDRRNTLSHSR
jgi:hypothetical protein